MKEKVIDLIPESEKSEAEIKQDKDSTGDIAKTHRIALKQGTEPIVKRITAAAKPVSEKDAEEDKEKENKKQENKKQESEEQEKKEAVKETGAGEASADGDKPEGDKPADEKPGDGKSEGEGKEAGEKKGDEIKKETEEEGESAEPDEEDIPPKPRWKLKPPNPRVIKRIAACLVILVLVGYLTGLVIFSFVFYPQTVLNGIDCGMKTASETEKLISEAVSGYEIDIEGRNGIKGTITSKDISLMPVFHGEVKKTLKGQKPFAWFILFNRPVEYNVEEVTLYSKEALRQCIDKMPFFEPQNIIAPQNAYIGDITDEGYVITKEDNGAVPLKEEIVAFVGNAVDTLERSVSIDNDVCYKAAEVTSTDKELNTLVENLNAYCAAKITYKFGTSEEVLDGSSIAEWITVDGTEVSFDEAKVSEYVTALAKRYDTFGQPHKFRTHSGEEITVTQGAYGWWIDRPAETEGLIEAIKSGYRGERTPVYKSEGAVRGENDYGDDYVEIDLTSQHVWVYKGGKVVAESDCVSGNISKNNGTHVGIYGITYKERNATLRGANYASHVSYWMPFNGNEGMHDATWRSSFGGDIYLTSGSHGCVNLPLANASKIFDAVEKGEAVIVYGGKTYTPPAPQPVDPLTLDPMQQLQLLIDAGILNPDGTIPETTTVQE